MVAVVVKVQEPQAPWPLTPATPPAALQSTSVYLTFGWPRMVGATTDTLLSSDVIEESETLSEVDFSVFDIFISYSGGGMAPRYEFSNSSKVRQENWLWPSL